MNSRARQLRVLAHGVARGIEDARGEIEPVRVGGRRADQLIRLYQLIQVLILPAGRARRGGADAAALVRTPRERRLSGQTAQRVRECDLRLVVERVAGVDRGLAVAEQVVGRRHTRRPVAERRQLLFHRLAIRVEDRLTGIDIEHARLIRGGFTLTRRRSGRSGLFATQPPRYFDVCQS